jgi:tRNA pseudouridine65 synthase
MAGIVPVGTPPRLVDSTDRGALRIGPVTTPADPPPVLYQDEAVIAVDKPSGLLVHRGWGRDRVVALTLVRDLVGQRVHPVHRLDRGTSGVLLFALSPDAARVISEAFEAGRVRKRYLALVRGVAPVDAVIDQPVPVRPKGPRKAAVTEMRLLSAARGSQPRACSWVEAWPRTGRLHQVRRHLKHLGHPVLGDANYGKGALNRAFREAYGLARLALHAAELTFPHPVTGEPLTVAAALPADLAEPLKRIGLI